MKNKFNLAFGFSIILISILGCSFYNPLAGGSNTAQNSNSKARTNENKSLTDQAIESTVGGTTTGVAECDELLIAIADLSNNQNDDYVTKATREFFLNRIRDSVRKSIEENKGDKAEMAKNCADYQKQLTKFKAEEEDEKKSADK